MRLTHLVAALAALAALAAAPASADTVAPSILSVTPAAGPATGGTTVTIVGAHFGGAIGVSFGGEAAARYSVGADGTTITAVAPAGSGIVDVVVTTPAGTSARGSGDRFTYRPVVTDLTPASGSISGGTEVTIAGAGLTGATAVRFGNKDAVEFSVDTDAQITAVAPEGGGAVDVKVIGPAGTSGSRRYTYRLAVAGAAAGPGAGQVTLTGIGFAVARHVRVGSVFAGFAVVSDTQMIIVVPPGAAVGSARVTIETPYGTTPPVDAPLPAGGTTVSPTVRGGSVFGGGSSSGSTGGAATLTVRLLGRPTGRIAGKTAVFSARVGLNRGGTITVSLLDSSGRQIAQSHRTTRAATTLQLRMTVARALVVRGARYRLAVSGRTSRAVSSLFRLR